MQCPHCDQSLNGDEALALHLADDHEWEELSKIDKRRIENFCPDRSPDSGIADRLSNIVVRSPVGRHIQSSSWKRYSSRRDILQAIGISTVGVGLYTGVRNTIVDAEQVASFATVSDGHLRPGDAERERRHEMVISHLNEVDLDLVIHAGDIADQAVHPDGSVDALETVRDQYLNETDIPYRVAHGNHDAVSESEWEGIFDVEFDHTFELDNIGFIVLDSADQSRSEIAPNIDFLRAALEDFSDKEHVFVVSHYWFNQELAVRLEGAGHATEFSPEAVETIHNSDNVTAIIHGHNHGPTHRDIHYLPREGTELPYVMTGVFAPPTDEETVFGFRLWNVYDDGTVETRYVDLEGAEISSEVL